MRQAVVDAINHGTFRWENFFPGDPRATERVAGTFYDYAQTWLDSAENDWKPQTRYKWRGILNRVWMPDLAHNRITACGYLDISATLASAVAAHRSAHGKDPSKSLYNDWLTCLRGVFDMAVRGGVLTRTTNPAAEFRNKTRERTEPDPFGQDEADAIIADIYRHDGDMWGAWFELGFFAGLRYPSEPSALAWSNIDLRRGEMRITQIRSKHAKGGIQGTTKTGIARTVMLNSRSLGALSAARRISGFKGGWVFIQPNGGPVITGDPQRAMWRASLARLKIRYRDPYNMRHSYASITLSAGANPAFMARQLGHSLEEFFKTYAKWIDRTSNQFQMDVIETGISKSVAKVGQKYNENN